MPGENIQDWSTTAASNATADSSINWAEGQTRASVNNSARSMMAAEAKQRNLTNGSITTGGTANVQTFSSGLSYTSVPTGLRVLLKIGVTNTASTTLNMDSIGAVTIKNQFAADLTGGQLTLNAYGEFRYDGTNWILLHQPSILVTVVGSLPSASVVGAGARAFVTDALNTTFASVVIGSGSNNVPVYSDGTDWRIG